MSDPRDQDEIEYKKPFSLSELGEGLKRAASRGAKTPVFSIRKGVFAQAAKRTGRDFASAASEISAAAKAASTLVDQVKNLDPNATPHAPPADVPLVDDATVQRFITNALMGWRIYAVMFAAGSALAVSSQIWTSATATNQLIWGVLMMLASGYQCLRITHDILIMETRMVITAKQFFAEIDDLWCPITNPKERRLYAWLLAPLSFLGLLAACVLTLV